MTLEIFVDLSVVLTGFSKNKLQPQHDTLQLSEEYYNTLLKEVNPTLVAQLSAAFTSLQGDNKQVDPVKFKSDIIDNTVLGPVAKNIIKMWYVGIWYYITPETEQGYIISDNAYTHGLVWDAMLAHPMGYSEGNFGNWDSAPAPANIAKGSGYGSN